MVLISEGELERLPADPLAAFHTLATYAKAKVKEHITQHNLPRNADVADALVAVYAYLRAFATEARVSLAGFQYTGMTPEKICDTLISAVGQAVATSTEMITRQRAQSTDQEALLRAKNVILRRAGNLVEYEFSTENYARVQELINQLRDEVTNSPHFEPKHKQRILNRLEKLQSELHKKMSNLDTSLGVLVEVGFAVGKMGAAAKPMVDMLKELKDIVLNTMALVYGTALPSSVPDLALPFTNDGPSEENV